MFPLADGDPASPIQQLEFGPNLFWQAPLLAFLLFIASSAGSLLLDRILPSRADRVKVSRQGAADTLDAVLLFQNAIEARNNAGGDDPSADATILTLRSALHVAAAKTGDATIREDVSIYARTGYRWAMGTPRVTDSQVETAFQKLMNDVATFMHKNR